MSAPFLMTPEKVEKAPVAADTVNVGVPATLLVIVPAPVRPVTVTLWLFRSSTPVMDMLPVPTAEVLPNCRVPLVMVVPPV